jgi:hypothetical protein
MYIPKNFLCIYLYTYIYLTSKICLACNMASQTKAKLYKVESKSAKTGVKTYRHSIFLEKAFVEDSLFPFKPGENLIVRIDKDRLIVTKLKD